MDKACSVHLVIDTDEDFLQLSTDWLNWRGVSRALGVGKTQAHKIMGTFGPDNLAEVLVTLDGYDHRPQRFVRRVAIEHLVRRKKGNPRWKDTTFQQEMANRRWHPKQNAQDEPETPLERGYFREDEVHLIRI